MTHARIMPAQRLDLATKPTNIRWGFVINNHPNGCRIDPTSPNSYYKDGDYVASWPSKEMAQMAAYSLGLDPNIVQGVTIFVPQEDDEGTTS